MKRVNLIISIFLCSIALLTLAFSGCKKNKPTQSSSSSEVRSSSVEVNTNTAVDRSSYTFDALINMYQGYKTSDFVSAIDSETLFKDAEGYMMGDIFNSLIDKANQFFPSGSNIANLIGYTYYSDGNWYNNSTKLKTHKIMNAFLNYKLDGSESLQITSQDFEVYGENKLVDFTGYTKSVIEIINASNPLIYNLINSSLNEWAVLLQSDNRSEKVIALYDMCGESNINDIVELISKENSLKIDVLIKDAVISLEIFNAIKYDFVDVLCLNLYRESDDGKTNELLNETFIYDNKEYTVNSAIDHLLCKNQTIDFLKEIVKNKDLKAYFSGLYGELNKNYGAQLDAVCNDFINAFLNNADSGNKTIEQIASAINLSETQKETALCYCFDILAYVDTAYGQEIETDGLTLSDIILYINEFFAGQNSYNSLTVKQLTAFFTSLNKNDLQVFATDTIKKNELAITNEIQNYIANNLDKNITLDFEKIVDISKDSQVENNLGADDIELLKYIDFDKIFKQNNQAIVKTEVAGVDELVDELLSVNLYEIIYGISDVKLENFKSCLNGVDVFSAVNYAINTFKTDNE